MIWYNLLQSSVHYRFPLKQLFQAGTDLGEIRDTIIQKFKELVDSSQLIVREDLFLDALNLSPESLDTLRKVVVELGETYPEYGETLPKHWMELQEKISELKGKGTRIISITRLKSLNGELETPLSDEELDLFLSSMHNAGYLLRFKDTGLSEMVILDPKLVIDAMKCFVTCKKFALDVWGKKQWEKMSTSGKLKQSYIIKVWRKRSKKLYFENREFLFRVMEKLDLITRPVIYEQGHEVVARFYYVPSMVKEVVQYMPSYHDGVVSVLFRFHEILPPAVFNRLICSCLSLWTVQDGDLYEGYVELESGLNHRLVIRRQFKTIVVSFVHKTCQNDIDMNLCRSVKQYISQSIHRIVSLYDTASTDGKDELYVLEYNENARAKHLDEVLPFV